jgi:hypothetical protein
LVERAVRVVGVPVVRGMVAVGLSPLAGLVRAWLLVLVLLVERLRLKEGALVLVFTVLVT